MGRVQTFLDAGRSLLRKIFRAHSSKGNQSTNDLYNEDLENQIKELEISIKTAETERNNRQRENQVLKDLLGENGIPIIPPPATDDDLP